jgi:hypothetical protein
MFNRTRKTSNRARMSFKTMVFSLDCFEKATRAPLGASHLNPRMAHEPAPFWSRRLSLVTGSRSDEPAVVGHFPPKSRE